MDLDRLRRRFPGLQSDWILLDNAGGSQILDSAIERVREFYVTSHVQAGGTYAPSRLLGERMTAATAALARMINAAPDEVVIGASTTQLLQNLSRAIEPSIRPGDEVVVTNIDHESNIGPWLRFADRGAVVKWWNVRPDFELAVDDLARLLTKRTKLVAFAHVSNVLGHVNAARDAVRLAHDAGALALVDGVAYAPHRRIDVRDLDADFYVFSLYKVYGPHQAALFGKRARLADLTNVNHFFIEKMPSKLQPGGLTFELVHAAGAVPDYLDTLDFADVAAHETTLAERVLSLLRSKRWVRIIGRDRGAPDRLPTISFVVEGRNAADIPARVDAHKVGIKYGDFYARRLCDALGLTAHGGVVRASMVHYNTMAEMDRLCEALDEVIPSA